MLTELITKLDLNNNWPYVLAIAFLLSLRRILIKRSKEKARLKQTWKEHEWLQESTTVIYVTSDANSGYLDKSLNITLLKDNQPIYWTTHEVGALLSDIAQAIIARNVEFMERLINQEGREMYFDVVDMETKDSTSFSLLMKEGEYYLGSSLGVTLNKEQEEE